MKRRDFLYTGLIFAGGQSIPAFAAGTSDSHPSGDVLRMSYSQTPRHFNSAVASGTATTMFACQLFASPLRFDDNWKPQPYFATSWDFASDGKTLTLHLREGAIFHDGKPITSEDVAYSLMAVKQFHPYAPLMAPLEKVDTPTPHTAVLHFSHPHPAALLALSPAFAPILPKHIYDDGTDLRTHIRNSQDVVGSGPFRLTEFAPGHRIQMERFDGYFIKDHPRVAKVAAEISGDFTGQLINIEQDGLDMIVYFPGSVDLNRLKKNKSIQMTKKGYEAPAILVWAALNLENKLFSDIRVRKAIAHAVDLKFLNKVLNSGYSQSLRGPIAPFSPFFVEDAITDYPLDMKKAAALLDDAGYPIKADGHRMKVTVDFVPASSAYKRTAEYFVGRLKKLNIDATVRVSPDLATYATRLGKHEYDIAIEGIVSWGEPVIGTHRSFLSSNIKNAWGTNIMSYRNKKVDQLLEAAGEEMDPVKRKGLYGEFQKIVTDELPVVFLYIPDYYTVTRDDVTHMPTSIWGPLSPWDNVSMKS